MKTKIATSIATFQLILTLPVTYERHVSSRSAFSMFCPKLHMECEDYFTNSIRRFHGINNWAHVGQAWVKHPIRPRVLEVQFFHISQKRRSLNQITKTRLFAAVQGCLSCKETVCSTTSGHKLCSSSHAFEKKRFCITPVQCRTSQSCAS